MRFAIADIHEIAKERPPGYLEEVLAAGTMEGADFLIIPAPVYTKLFAKFRGEEVPVFEKDIATAVEKFKRTCTTCP